jgi:hypothetical protein
VLVIVRVMVIVGFRVIVRVKVMSHTLGLPSQSRTDAVVLLG